jgi:hypothetical protein
VLLAAAREGEHAALFAGAEFARDSLRAPRLARRLFLDYADSARATVWAPKALLAALPLSTEAERPALEQRLRGQAANPYIAAVQGRTDDAAYYRAESELGLTVGALRSAAAAQAQSGDLRVGRALALRDSVRARARADSVTAGCGALLDSLSLRGVRADSARAACLRTDTAALGRYLVADTLLLRDSTGSGGRNQARRDTLLTP